MNNSLLEFYSRLYRCEDCKEITNPKGVFNFVNGRGKPSTPSYFPPTIPVSHFGDIANSILWIVTTNPKGDRTDPLVGLNVHQFSVNSRSDLREFDIKSIFETQCNYFVNRRGHLFFNVFFKLLEGIKYRQQILSFRTGDMCFIDAIKCPTEIAWQGFVRSKEGKQVWDNCLRIKNKFLQRQLELHKPKIVVYYGTGSLIKVRYKGKLFGIPMRFSNNLTLQTRHLFNNGAIERISIEFSKARLNLPDFEMNKVRNYIERTINQTYTCATSQVELTKPKIDQKKDTRDRLNHNFLKQKLTSLGYKNTVGKTWVKGNKTIHIVQSSQFGKRTRIYWRESWKGHQAIIYDYSKVQEPVCIVPISKLFSTDFVRKKREQTSYANSIYWWSQKFPKNHELIKLILSYKDRWAIL